MSAARGNARAALLKWVAPSSLRVRVAWIGLGVLFGTISMAPCARGQAQSPAPAQAPAPTAEEKRSFDAARKAFQDGNYAVARQFFAEFIQQFPLSDRVPEAGLLQARALLEQGNAEECVKLLEARVANSGKVADEYHYWLGSALYRKGDFRQAADQFALLPKDHPTSARRLEAAYGEARARFKLGEWNKVVELLRSPQGSFREAARTRANDDLFISGDLMLIEALLELRNFKEAQTVVQTLASRPLTPEMKWRYEQLACRLLLQSQDYPAALRQSTNAVAAAAVTGIIGFSAESLGLQATILSHLHRWPEAAQVYELNLAPTSPQDRQREALLQLIQLHLAQDQFGQATQRLDQLLARSPSGSTNQDVILLTYGELFLRQYALSRRDPSTNAGAVPPESLLVESLNKFDQLLRTTPGSPLVGLAHLNRGWCLWAEDRLPESLEAFRSATKALPYSEDQAVSQFKQGEIQYRLHDYTNSLATFRDFTNQFIRLPRIENSLLDQALIHLMRIGFELHDAAGATDALEKLLAWKPKSEYVDTSLLLMGQRLTLLGDSHQAREWLDKIPAQSPQKALAELGIARTFVQENSWSNALVRYEGWFKTFTNQTDLLPEAQLNYAWTLYQSGNESNAFVLFTNFVSLYPTSSLAPRAQYWIGDYYYRQENFTNAEIQFDRLYTNRPATELTYRAKMQAGLAAFARQGYNNAKGHFTQIVNDSPPYPDLVAKAYFALGDCLMTQATLSTNALGQYGEASKAFANITRLYETNAIASRAWGNLGNCYFQLAKQDPAFYTEATNAYHQVLNRAGSTVTDRSIAFVGLGLALSRLAETYSASKEKQTLLEQAQENFQRVLYEKNVGPGERPDPYWQKTAGLEAAKLAESTGDWNAAVGVYERLRTLFPQLAPYVERQLPRLRARMTTDKP